MIEQSKAALDRLYTARDNLDVPAAITRPSAELNEAGAGAHRQAAGQAVAKFDEAMDDDLNTADAIGAIFELVKEGNLAITADTARAAIKSTLSTLKEMTDVLGILSRENDAIPDDIKALVEQRKQARAEKNWAESDRLRDEITARGFVLEDTPKGAKVRRA